MRVCDECGRNHYGTGKLCSTCYKRKRDESMSFSSREYELGKPVNVILMKMIDIHYLCSCTWVFDHNTGMHRLKYRHMACQVMHWHKEMEKKSQNAA